MRFGSVCSGIEAASVAWEPLGWKAAWFAEIEPFPSAVLAHHYPDTPNLGDMSKLPERIRAGEVEAPDLFCGGTPCQAFSVAGQRRSLDDARGNLSLTFCTIANEIDAIRSVRGEPACIVFWENVPGVLNTKDNAFGCFLAELAGESVPLQPAGGKWTNAGCVLGPTRAVAWRVTDAQYFGVAQRRRRVFVVASARDGFDPAAVLFEFDGLRRDTAASREAREVAPTIPARSLGGGGLGTDFDCDGGVIRVAGTLGASCGDWTRDNIGESVVPVGVTIHGTDPTVQKVASYDEVAQCLRARTPGNIDNSSTTVVQQPVTGVKYAHYSHDYAHDRITDPAGVNPALTKEAHASGNLNVAVPVAFHPTQDPISSTDGTTRCMGTGSSQGGATVAVAAWTTKLHNTASNNAGKIFEERATCLDANSPPPALLTAMQVRRLTPVECERLQGFPDNYTAIPWRKKPASECPDGPRYKALGNSWAVPNVRWIGRRIAAQLHANDNFPSTLQLTA